MAIYSAVPPPPGLGGTTTNASQQQQQPQSAVAGHPALDIEAWTVSALQSLAISPDARGTNAPLSIPLDGSNSKPSVTIQDARATGESIRRPLSRRDSMKRREALLKGKEGSRQRRRWENGTYNVSIIINDTSPRAFAASTDQMPLFALQL